MPILKQGGIARLTTIRFIAVARAAHPHTSTSRTEHPLPDDGNPGNVAARSAQHPW